MPKHLISVEEAVAMLTTIGTPPLTVKRFEQQAKFVLDKRPSLGNDHIIVTSLYGSKSEEAAVNLQVGSVQTQMDVKIAQAIGLDIIAAAQAAISDVAFVQFLLKMGMTPDHASVALLDLRELRQGTRGTVFHT